jgi:uncharacterized protein YjbI with pentapeptide repeats
LPEEADQQETAAGSEKPDAQALLDAANRASERVAGVHLAFMAICAYVLVTVFGTTDLDLLLGKGVRLPVVNVEMPLVGFFALAPYIVVLVHFNLLLQLQLLSRKLFAFEAAAPPEEGLGGLRDRLHIFPYTYYLVGRPSPLVRPFLGLMVSITVVLLPLITLLVLQLWFLAYQSEAVTWWQRGAIWLDIAMIAILWPVILHPEDKWGAYWRDLLAALVPRRRAWLALGVLFFGFVLSLFGILPMPIIGVGLLLVSALTVTPLRGWGATSRLLKISVAGLVAAAILAYVAGGLLKSPILFLLGPLLLLPLAVLWQPRAPRGSLALLLTLLLGLLLPLALQVDGEGLEGLVVHHKPRFAQLPSPNPYSKEPIQQPEGLEGLVFRLQPGSNTLPSSSYSTLLSWFLQDYRRLDLNEQVLLAKPPQPETLALIRSGEWQEGLKRVEPLNLQGRSLRQAKMYKAILLGADLRWAQLQGALLVLAYLQGTNLIGADLQGADLWRAGLQSADLWRVELQGANLRMAQLQGADLWGAGLQGAELERVELQGANLRMAQLQGANLGGAQLQGANFLLADLQGADLRKANLYAAEGVPDKSELIDARWVAWKPMPDYESRALSNDLQKLIKDPKTRQQVLGRLAKACRPGAPKLELQSCLARSDTPLSCERRYDPENPRELAAFKNELHAYLGKLACTSPWIAQGLVRQILQSFSELDQDPDSSRRGLEVVLKKRLDDNNCPGLRGLSQEWKDKLKAIK